MPYRRGDVVLVIFPNADMETYKKRPALVVQADDADTKLEQRIVACITSNMNRRGPTRIPVQDPADRDLMGLNRDSMIVADNLATVGRHALDKAIGTCAEMDAVDHALRVALGL